MAVALGRTDMTRRRTQRLHCICTTACPMYRYCGGEACDRPRAIWDIDMDRRRCGPCWFFIPARAAGKREDRP